MVGREESEQEKMGIWIIFMVNFCEIKTEMREVMGQAI